MGCQVSLAQHGHTAFPFFVRAGLFGGMYDRRLFSHLVERFRIVCESSCICKWQHLLGRTESPKLGQHHKVKKHAANLHGSDDHQTPHLQLQLG